MESVEQRIMRKSGRKPTSCKCNVCKNQCMSVGLDTPSQILGLIKAGYGSYIEFTEWAVPLIVGKSDMIIPMFQLDGEITKVIDGVEYPEANCCMQDSDGLCKIHNLTYDGKRLKPLECILSNHKIRKDNFCFSKSLHYLIAKEWLNEENLSIIRQIAESVFIDDNGNKDVDLIESTLLLWQELMNAYKVKSILS